MKNKILKEIKNKEIVNYLIIIIVSSIISIPLLKISLLETGDTKIHLLRIIGIDKAINNSVFPFLITPFYCNNFGYATNLFYPQMVTYIPYILKIFTPSYESALELFASITIILSGIFMYNFTKQLTNNKVISLISSIIYITFPYRFECIYERFAIGEFTSFIFIPIIFQGLDSLINKNKSKHYLIAIGTSALLLSHTIITIYTLIFCIIYILFNLKLFLKKEVIKKCFINIIFIILITSLFTIPLLEHRNATSYTIFNTDIMRGLGEDVYDNSASLKQLLTDKGSSKTVSFIIGWPVIIYLLLGIYSYKKLDKKDKEWYLTFEILGFISIYMVSKLFPWQIMPGILTMVQFSWRILTFFSFFIAPICAINIYTIVKNFDKKIFKILISGIFVSLLIIFTTIRLYQYIDEKKDAYEKYKNYEQEIIDNPIISHMKINREYLSEKALKGKNNYLETRQDKVYILKGNSIILDENKENLNMSFKIKNYNKNTILELPYLYYLGYNIKINQNGNINILNYVESENGFINIEIPYDIETAEITINYTGTVLEKIEYVISILGLISLIIYIVLYKRKDFLKNENK